MSNEQKINAMMDGTNMEDDDAEDIEISTGRGRMNRD